MTPTCYIKSIYWMFITFEDWLNTPGQECRAPGELLVGNTAADPDSDYFNSFTDQGAFFLRNSVCTQCCAGGWWFQEPFCRWVTRGGLIGWKNAGRRAVVRVINIYSCQSYSDSRREDLCMWRGY